MNTISPFRCTQILLYIAACTLSACVSLDLAHPTVARVHALPINPGDTIYHYDDENHATLLLEGIPATWFGHDNRGWTLTAQQAANAADLRDKLRNP